MKKHLTKLALTAALGLAITFTLNACEEKGGGNAKLLETITDQSSTRKFEYDKQNRIVKIDDKTITYADNLITVGTQKYAINGKTITVDGKSFTINGDGYIVKNEDGAEFKYENSNLSKITYGDTDIYSYDNKKSPFSGCTTPKWLIQRFIGDNIASKNNVIYIEGHTSSTYKYEYDSDGFPVTVTVTSTYHDGCEENCEESTTIRYTYRGEPQTATAPAEKASGSQPSGEEGCPDSKEPPITTEAVFLRNSENAEGIGFSTFRLPDGEEAMDFNEHNLKEGDKVSITYKSSGRYDGEERCYYFKEVLSVKKKENEVTQ